MYGDRRMVDLGAFEEDVDFAWGEASRLQREFEHAAELLEDQIPSRRSRASHAKDGWDGRYASVFEHQHMSCTIDDARAIAAEMRRCAKMLEQLANLAKQENERRAIAREWQAEHDEWERKRGDGVGQWVKDLDGTEEPKPPDVPEIKPQPFVATSPPSGERS
jgi:hypothetical protein